MKRAIFSFFLLAVTQCSFAQWVSEYNDSLSQYLLPEFERISFSSPEVGVGACADTLGSGFSNNISSLVFTSDSGKSWRTTFFLDSFRIWDVEFITNNMVMAVGHRIRGSSIANKNGIICTSLDSGQTWSIQYFNEYLKYVEKVDSVKTIVLG